MRPDRWLIPIAFLGFVSLGLPDGVLGVAWPSLRRTFERPIDHLGFILLASMTGYLTASLAGGALVSWLKVGRLLTGSGLLVAAGATIWALTPAWTPILVGALALGLGAGAIDAGINAFAATRFTPRVVTWLHASWGLGAMLGPLGMTVALASGAGWRAGYLSLALALVLLSAGFGATRHRWDALEPAANTRLDRDDSPPLSRRVLDGFVDALGNPAVRGNIVVFYLYTGIEAGAGQWAYTLLTESRGLAPSTAGLASSGYWGSIFAGRVLFGAIAHHVAPAILLRVAVSSIPLLALALWSSRGAAPAFAALLLMGLLLAPIFPLLISETPSRVGERDAVHAVGFQVAAATLGAATLPALAGVLMKRVGLEILGPFLCTAALLLLAARRLGR